MTEEKKAGLPPGLVGPVTRLEFYITLGLLFGTRAVPTALALLGF